MNNPTHLASDHFPGIWELGAAVRFPLTPEEWDRLPALPPRPRHTVIGHQAFDLMINHRARRAPSNTMKKLLASFPETFAASAVALRPHEWRTLHYLDLYPFAALGNPTFDGVRAFLDILDRDASLNDVPQDWTGSPEPTACILLDLRAIVSDLSPDAAKAVWAVLAFSRQLGMEKHEVLRLPWWSTWWISRFVSFEYRYAIQGKPKT